MAENDDWAAGRKVELTVAPNGTGKLLVNGVDLSRLVQKVEIVAGAHDATRVTLHMVALQIEAHATPEQLAIIKEIDEERERSGRAVDVTPIDPPRDAQGHAYREWAAEPKKKAETE